MKGRNQMLAEEKQERITFHRGGTFLYFCNRSFDFFDLHAYFVLLGLLWTTGNTWTTLPTATTGTSGTSGTTGTHGTTSTHGTTGTTRTTGTTMDYWD